MFCSHCGAHLPEGSHYCLKCGKPVSEFIRMHSSSIQDIRKYRFPAWFKTALVLIIVGALIVFWSAWSRDNLETIAGKQLKAIRLDKITEAYYGYTSNLFQKKISLKEFRKFVEDNPVLAKNKKYEFLDDSVEDSLGSLEGILVSKDGQAASVNYTFLKEDKKWKILSIQLGDIKQNEGTDGILKPLRTLFSLLKEDNIQEAYKSTVSKEFREGTPYSDFVEFVDAYPVLKNYNDIKFQEKEVKDTEGSVFAILTTDTGLYPVENKLVKEDGEWKIWSLKIHLSESEAIKSETHNPNQLIEPVEKQLKLLKDAKIDEAYSITSNEFKDATSREAFESFIQNFPILTEHTSARFKTRSIVNGSGELQVELEDEQNTLVLQYILVFENDEWKVLGFKVIQPEEIMKNSDSNETAFVTGSLHSHIAMLGQGEVKKAYTSMTTEDFKNDTSYSEFEEFVRRHPETQNGRGLFFERVNVKGNKANVQGYVLAESNKKKPVEYQLINKNGTWKIDRLSISEDAHLVSQIKHIERTTPHLDFGTIRIGQKIGMDGEIVNPTDNFSGKIGDLYVTVDVLNGVTGTTVYLYLEHEETQSSTTPLRETLEKNGDQRLNFMFKKPKYGWFGGNYRVVVTSSSGDNKSIEFLVK